MFTGACHWFLSLAQIKPVHSLRRTSSLHYPNLRQGLPSNVVSSGCPTEILCAFSVFRTPCSSLQFYPSFNHCSNIVLRIYIIEFLIMQLGLSFCVSFSLFSINILITVTSSKNLYILIIVQRDATQSSLFIVLNFTLHVSGVNHTHHQEYTQL